MFMINEVFFMWCRNGNWFNWLIPKVNQQLSKVLTLRKVGPFLYLIETLTRFLIFCISRVTHKESWGISNFFESEEASGKGSDIP